MALPKSYGIAAGWPRGPGQPTYPSNSYLGQVTSRVGLTTNINLALRQFRARRTFIASDNIINPILVFPNWYVDSFQSSGKTYQELGPGAATTLTAAIEYPIGSGFTQVTFSGSVSGSIPNLSDLFSDPVPISIPIGAQFKVRTYGINANGIVFENGASTGTNVAGSLLMGDICDFTTTTVTDNTMGGGYTASTGTSGYGPRLILARTTKPSVLMFGDSLVYGEHDTGDTSGDVGVFQRAIGTGGIAYASYGQGGDSVFRFNSNSTLRRNAMQYFTHIMTDYGINDFIVEGRNASQIRTDTLALYTLLRASGKKILISTMMPAATTTDNYATTLNQTPASYDASRITENNARRLNAAGWDGILEIADVVESARDSGLWKPGLGYLDNTSSVHPKQAGYLAITASGVINPNAFTN